jgi:hypothetical protein
MKKMSIQNGKRNDGADDLTVRVEHGVTLQLHQNHRKIQKMRMGQATHKLKH